MNSISPREPADLLLQRCAATWLLLFPFVMLAPLAAYATGWPIFSSTMFGRHEMVIEVFCGLAVLAAGGAAAVWHRRQGGGAVTGIPTAAFVLAVATAAWWIGEVPGRSPDYKCYEDAARAILAATNPYEATAGTYRYPPATAQAIAAAAAGLIRGGADSHLAWLGVFYLYQTAQLVLVGGAFLLAYALGRRLGLDSTWSAGLVLVLVAFSNPVVRTLRFNQTNLWILDLALIALLAGRSQPALGGVAIALATHLKVYPAILVAAFAGRGHWRIVGWAAAAFIGIAAAALALPGGASLWRDFVSFASGFPAGTAFRDNSLRSVVHNTVALLAPGALSPRTQLAVVTVAWLVACAATVMWFAVRFARRRRDDAAGGAMRQHAADGADALACGLMISPMAWEHHFVLAIPLAIVATAQSRLSTTLLLGLFLLFVVPTFDVFALSYHRLAGLVLLLAVTAPRPQAPRIVDAR